MKLRLYRIGSDPEFAFVRTQGQQRQVIVPADQVLTANREVGLAAFIGTDGHQALGEYRPRPAHNVWAHIVDLAIAIDATTKYLSEKKKFTGVSLVATPYLHGETLGGHIHLSFFIDDPASKAAQALGYIYTNQLTTYDPTNAGRVIEIPHDVKTLQTYARRAYYEESFGTLTLVRVLHSLLLPFECWVQPWTERLIRNQRYGVGRDTIRMMHTRPTINGSYRNYEDLAYYHMEYRMPSTWLSHPTITYAYLALAKLCILNYETLISMSRDPLPADLLSPAPQNHFAREYFYKNYEQLIRNGARVTKDLHALPSALEQASLHRERWMKPNAAIDVVAWRNTYDLPFLSTTK